MKNVNVVCSPTRKLKIAFMNRPRTWDGGDLVQIDATMAALRRLGVACEEVSNQDDLSGFDLCHLVHCNFEWAWNNVRAVRKAKKKYVLTPMYYPNLFSGITLVQLSEILNGSASVIPFSYSEALELQPYYTGEIDIVPNGTDKAFHSTCTEGRDGVLCVIARNGEKNVDTVADVCKELGLFLTTAIGISREDLPAVYKQHKVFVNASDSERMSLTIGEALCANCKVLATSANRGNTYYPGLVTFDPKDKEKLKTILTLAQADVAGWDYFPNMSARKLTWDFVADMLMHIYEREA